MEVICQTCGKAFDKNASELGRTQGNFCSKSCAAKTNNRKHPKRSLPWETLTIADLLRLHGKQHNIFNKVRQRARNLALQSFPNECVKCGYSKHVETCHIKGIAHFPKTAKISEVNALSNLMLLCPNCHWEFDNAGV